MLSEICRRSHETARSKGFWSGEARDFPFLAYKLTMIHSEVTEIMEAVRKSKGVEETENEFADVIIRLADLYEACKEEGIVFRDLDEVVEAKMVFNASRGQMHGVKG
jgi:NTP pyrophosphatase (non-canonical NTP hydrolase)